MFSELLVLELNVHPFPFLRVQEDTDLLPLIAPISAVIPSIL